jgi:hypothetical protein
MDVRKIKQKIAEISKQMEIDKDRLEDECVHQPNLYAEIRALLTEAREYRDVKKNEQSLIFSEVSAKILASPESYDLDKPTVKAVENAAVKSEEYQTAVTEAIEANTVYEALLGLKDAAEQRKSMIRELVSLFVHEYYSNKTDLDKTARKDLEKVENDDLEDEIEERFS